MAPLSHSLLFINICKSASTSINSTSSSHLSSILSVFTYKVTDLINQSSPFSNRLTGTQFVRPKMDKYSKIKIMGSHSKASRSMDFSDLQSFSPTQKPNNVTTNKTQETNHPQIQKNNTTQHHEGDGDGDGDEGGDDDRQTKHNIDSHVVLKRNSSISSSSSAASGFQSAVKGAFSMRRSSSVSERYCRIHDQYSSATLASSPIDDDEEDQARYMRKTHRGGKILKACKRFFGI